jgi:hypothetical protein
MKHTEAQCRADAAREAEAGDPDQSVGPPAPNLTAEQVCNIGFAVLRAHNDDRLWRALTYDSGPYDLTTPNLALQELGAAFYAAGYAEAPKTTMKVEISSDPEMLRRTLKAECEVALLRAALTLPAVQDVSAIPLAWASSIGWRANQLMSAEQYRQCLPKNRADFDVPLYGPDAMENWRRLADESQQDAARFRMLLQQHKHWLGIFRCDPDGAPSDSLDLAELKALLDQLIAQDRNA